MGEWQASGSAGLGVSVGPSAALGSSADVGFNANGKPTTMTGKIGITVGLDYPTLLKVPIGVSGGFGTSPKKIIGF